MQAEVEEPVFSFCSAWVLALHLQRSATGTPESAESMCLPQPPQLGLLHVLHVTFIHIFLAGGIAGGTAEAESD